MGKTSRYLIALGFIGVLIVGYWIYGKYFADTGASELRVAVTRGDMEELVQARGKIVPGVEYNLEFATSGVISGINVAEGTAVKAGAPIMRLDTAQLRLQRQQLDSLAAQRAADLTKLKAGGSASAIAVALAQTNSAQVALKEAQNIESVALRAVASAVDDAVHGTTDSYYRNPDSAQIQLSFNVFDSQLASAVLAQRIAINEVLARTEAAATSAAASAAMADQMQQDAAVIGSFLDKNADLLSKAIIGSVSASDIAAWSSAVAAARSALDTKRAALATAQAGRANAESALVLAQQQYESVRAPARPEDVAAAEAAVDSIKTEIALVDQKIRESTILAPEQSQVVRVNYRVGETFRPGTTAVILHALSPKVQSDVSELDIARIKTGLPVRITLDGLPGMEFSGAVSAIDPQKVDKDNDTYYRVSFTFASTTPELRTGMSADVVVVVSRKSDVVKIPEYMTYARDNKTYVRVIRDGVATEVPVMLGISDGSSREIISGISEGETVVVSTE